jgi:hypothetical protein
VSAQSNCSWTAVSNDPWIIITSGAGGTGNGTVAYTVSSNIEGGQPTPRFGTIFIGEHVFFIKQAGNNCPVSITPVSQVLPAGAGSAIVTGNSNGECLLSAVSNANWITITSPPTGTNGFLQVNYNYAANPLSTIRTGSISISGPYSTTNLVIGQAGQGCSYSVPTQTITADGTITTTGSIPVTATAGCGWTATTNDSWINITSGANGSGNGTVGYTLMRNNTPNFRGGHILVAGHDIFVSQSPSSCIDFSIAPAVLSIHQSGGQGIINVTTASYCQWTTDVNAGWVFITSPRPTRGSGYVEFTVMPNTTGVPRTAEIALPFHTVIVNQDGDDCFMTLSPITGSFNALGGAGNVSVTAPPGCLWSATSESTWLTINSGASGTGNGVVGYTVAGSLSEVERIGTLTIGGIPFKVTQSGCGVSITPNGISISASDASTKTINITAPAGCSWSSQTTDSWISIVSGQQGSGNGGVQFTVAANNGAGRIGTIAVAGQIFTVSQAAIQPAGISSAKADFDSDGKAEIGFYRTGLWGFLKSAQSFSLGSAQFFSWGGNGLQPICADFDGDNKADIAYIVPPSGGQSAAYAILQSSRAYSFAPGDVLFVPAGFPVLGDIPVVGDFDGDGKTDPGIWRASQGVWIITKSSTNYTGYIFSQWGQPGDAPVIADFDMDGKADIGFYRDGLWGVLKSGQNYSLGSAQFFSWGGAGLQPIVGDFDGDDKADIGYIVPPSGGQSAAYAILKSSTGYSFLPGDVLFVGAGFPVLGDTPVVGDFDGDGKDDPGIWRESQGVWILPRSTSNYTTFIFSQWGQAGDIAFPNSTGKH